MKKVLPVLIVLLILGLITGWFYWFQWRPSEIRKECGAKIIDGAQNATGINSSEIDTVYNVCIHARGI